jgi:hypothetical protein
MPHANRRSGAATSRSSAASLAAERRDSAPVLAQLLEHRFSTLEPAERVFECNLGRKTGAAEGAPAAAERRNNNADSLEEPTHA